MCALGKGLAPHRQAQPRRGGARQKDHRPLPADGATAAGRQPSDIVATAAVRDAENGKDFVRELERAHGIKITVVTGEREAELAAEACSPSVHEPFGISADLGGGSMELATVERTKIGHRTSCRLGLAAPQRRLRGRRRKKWNR
ncbi:MAG: hypothetical protein WDN72_00625 [Alphaproteobacteria bacterium]